MTRIELAAHDVVGIRAANPSLLTLNGTNSWIVGRDPAWIVDPGPALDAHLRALIAEAQARGGLAGVALTHSHADHAQAVGPLLARFNDAVLAQGPPPSPADAGPLEAISLPGHAPDHTVYRHGEVLFSGDAVLGAGSVFITPDPGALRGYLAGLERLLAAPPALILPGHGPVVEDPVAKLGEYLAHRREREARLLDALAQGRRSVAELLDAAWSEVPDGLRLPAALTLAAHLDKLEEEGRLPDGVERPAWPIDLGGAHP